MRVINVGGMLHLLPPRDLDLDRAAKPYWEAKRMLREAMEHIESNSPGADQEQAKALMAKLEEKSQQISSEAELLAEEARTIIDQMDRKHYQHHDEPDYD